MITSRSVVIQFLHFGGALPDPLFEGAVEFLQGLLRGFKVVNIGRIDQYLCDASIFIVHGLQQGAMPARLALHPGLRLEDRALILLENPVDLFPLPASDLWRKKFKHCFADQVLGIAPQLLRGDVIQI